MTRMTDEEFTIGVSHILEYTDNCHICNSVVVEARRARDAEKRLADMVKIFMRDFEEICNGCKDGLNVDCTNNEMPELCRHYHQAQNLLLELEAKNE